MQNKILSSQIEYYRARAQEYDRSISSVSEQFEPGKSMLLELGNFDQILELACGTGFWTETLLRMGEEVTAIDAAPEMLEIAKTRLGKERIRYQQADLFHWEPEQEYDFVFFANWLSHVPPTSLDAFLRKACHAVRPGGYIALIDQHAPSEADKQVAKEDIYAIRPLDDGSQFTIVKVFYELEDLKKKLEELGLEVTMNKFADVFFFLAGKRAN